MTSAERCEMLRIARQEERQLIPVQTSCLKFRLNKEIWGTTMNLC